MHGRLVFLLLMLVAAITAAVARDLPDRSADESTGSGVSMRFATCDHLKRVFAAEAAPTVPMVSVGVASAAKK